MNPAFPYRINVGWSAEDGAYVADVPALRSCSAHGDSVDEAVREVVAAAGSILEVLAEDGREPPPPDVRRLPSGRLLLRLPRSLHQGLIEIADADGVSLNQEIVALLAAAVAARGLTTRDHVTRVDAVSGEPTRPSLDGLLESVLIRSRGSEQVAPQRPRRAPKPR
jgi:predicted RNase H-like HicB family nuclease